MEEIQQRVGKNIRELRKAAGHRQDVFAERAGINRTHMGMIERGEVNVTLQTLKIVADALGVTVNDLTKGI